jgi:hypothetical protein
MTVAFLAAVLVSPDHALDAQEIRGVLAAAETGTVLPYGTVELLDENLRSVAVATGDVFGEFVLIAPGPGRYSLRGSHMTAKPLIAGPVELAVGQVVTLALSLPLQPIELDPLMVSVRPEYRRLVRNGFYERAKSGLGTFVSPEQVDRWRPTRTTDLLRRIPGVRLQPHPQWPSRVIITMTRSGMFAGGLGAGGGGRRCAPRIIVDDVELLDFDLDQLPAQDIFALEVYRSAIQVPPRYGGQGAACGAIVVWTGERLTFR